MKIKTINRSEEDYTRERSQDLQKVHRNYDPNLHQFQKAHEYNRALNAAKLDRVFAKPFIAALPHSDGITCLARNPRVLNSLLAGSADGNIKIWDIPLERCLRKLVGHTSAVRGIAFAPDGETCVSCSTDATIKLWKVPYAPFEAAPVESEEKAVMAFEGKHAFRGIDHHWQRNTFVTSSAVVEVWDHERSEPIHTFSWGADTVLSARFNPVSSAWARSCCMWRCCSTRSSTCPQKDVHTRTWLLHGALPAARTTQPIC
jgi:WD repeat and SOF domain-containing protein 1